MKRKIALFILVILCPLVIFLFGCGKNETTAAEVETTTTTLAPITISTTTSTTTSTTATTTTTTSSTTTTTYSLIPSNVSGFQALAGDSQVSLVWENPSNPNFAGVIILMKTDGFPSSATDGVVVYNGTGSSDVEAGINGVKYYFTAFSYNSSSQYSSGVTAEATPFSVTSGIVIGNNFAFYDYIDGYSYLVAQDGQYLGEISSNSYATNSIMNSYGIYGSEYSSTSIFNQYGTYGSPYASYSAYNPYTSSPPIIVLRTTSGNTEIAYMTKNSYLPYAIDPALLVAYYNTK